MAMRRGAEEENRQECWNLLTVSEKILLFLLIVTILLLIGALTFIGFLLLSEPRICETPNCIKASAELLDSADFSTDPCEDFFKFTCGNTNLYQEDCEEEKELTKLVLNGTILESDSSTIRPAKQFFQNCANVNIETSSKILRNLVAQIDNLYLKQEEKNFHWLKFLTHLRYRGIRSDWFLNFDYHVDANGTNLLMIGPPDFREMSNYEWLSPETIMLFLTDITQEDLEEITRFEERMKQINREISSLTRNGTTVEQLNRYWPNIKLVNVLNTYAMGHTVFTNDTLVIVASTDYIFKLNWLLRETNPRTQVNYLLWKIVESYLPFTSESFRKEYKKYSKYDIEDHCLYETIKRFYGSIETSITIDNKKDEVMEDLKSMAKNIVQSIDEYAEDPEVVIVGLDGENSGITNFEFHSYDIISMINEVHMHLENQFYTCLYKNSSSCVRETYHDAREPEIYFNFTQNTFHLPSNLLSGEFYALAQPNFINYARLGRSMGEAFAEELNKLYDGFDGLDLAYEAYVKFVQEEGADGRLPAINFSENQLFWIHSSSVHCKSANDSAKFEQVADSEHFREDFGC